MHDNLLLWYDYQSKKVTEPIKILSTTTKHIRTAYQGRIVVHGIYLVDRHVLKAEVLFNPSPTELYLCPGYDEDPQM